MRISVHHDHHPFPSDGSTIPVQLDDSIENLHFFTDRAADATLNPIALPFTAGIQDYIAVLAESISRQCVLDPSQRPITQDRLLRWAFTSYARANPILEVGSAGNWRFLEGEKKRETDGEREGTRGNPDDSGGADVFGGETTGRRVGADRFPRECVGGVGGDWLGGGVVGGADGSACEEQAFAVILFF